MKVHEAIEQYTQNHAGIRATPEEYANMTEQERDLEIERARMRLNTQITAIFILSDMGLC